MNKIGFVGLGVMGAPMAGHLSSGMVLMFRYSIELTRNLLFGNLDMRAEYATHLMT